ncbi:glycosyltransferase [Paenibacillus thermoaerophilus]|uniref:Glycosyltransferase n=1 Tax=Paenibacillus thermoaerophilus TaxID=1215385 RepID=A0ABW2V4D8_9BACL|nr:glycosyltransferase [Paenibacillus thermoaerophilus]TMV17494.1 glycosyltransferase family 4 protein [Paenibacillus thermoaerophilus]
MNSTRVLAVCIRKIPSALVGVIGPLNELHEQGIIQFQFKDHASLTNEDLAAADVVVSIRGSEQFDLELVRESKRLNKLVIYYLDDDLLNITEKSLSYEYFQSASIRSIIQEIMHASDRLWTTSDVIADRYKAFFSSIVLVNAPALLLDNDKRIEESNNDRIVIGFAGGLDHQYFFDEFMEKPIRRIIQDYGGRVRFQFVGARPKLVDELNLDYIPYEHNHAVYKNLMHQLKWDIGLAPLPYSMFHSCKYFNKYLEYGAIGAAGIYSNVKPYTRVITNGINGILVDNTENSWIEAMKSLIEQASIRNSIRQNAYDHISSHFSKKSVAMDIYQKNKDIFFYQSDICKPNQVKLRRSRNFFLWNKIRSIVKIHGFKTPIHILNRIKLYIKNKY